MPADDTPLTFIGDIYDAALDPVLWPEALVRIADFTRGQAAGIFSKESVSKSVQARHTAGFDPRYVQVYEERYAAVDPMSPLLFVAVDQVTSTTDFISYDDFRDGPFYQEWARPQGWVDAASAVLDKSAGRFDFLAVVRDEESGLVDDEMSERLRLVVPHVRRALAIGKSAETGLARTRSSVTSSTASAQASSLSRRPAVSSTPIPPGGRSWRIRISSIRPASGSSRAMPERTGLSAPISLPPGKAARGSGRGMARCRWYRGRTIITSPTSCRCGAERGVAAILPDPRSPPYSFMPRRSTVRRSLKASHGTTG